MLPNYVNFIKGTFDLLRLFGIDITGCTFGLSSLSTSVEIADENFIHPEQVNEFILQNRLKKIQYHTNTMQNIRNETGCKEEARKTGYDANRVENVSSSATLYLRNDLMFNFI